VSIDAADVAAISQAVAQRLGAERDRLLTRAELAERLQCSERAIASLAQRGELPGGFLVGGLRRWSWPDVLQFLEGRKGRRTRKGRGRFARNGVSGL
jgi:excisionase family DNA binding protein